MKRCLFLAVLFSFCTSVQGQFLEGITSHIWDLQEINDNGTIYTYDNFSTGNGSYHGGMDNISGNIMSVSYCSGFDVPVLPAGNRAFTISSNFTMRGSNCNSQAEQVKNDALINAFINATRTNGVATFNYSFENNHQNLKITTPDNIEIKFSQSPLSNEDQLAQNFETFYNRSTEELIIRSTSASESFKLSLFDLGGKMILKKSYEPALSKVVDLEAFKKGMYIGIIESFTGKTSFKFVK